MDAYYADLIAKGATPQAQDYDYGMCDFALEDPDGNLGQEVGNRALEGADAIGNQVRPSFQ